MMDGMAEAVRAAEQRRCAAMIASDAATLTDLLDDRLRFHHSSGLVDDKSGYMAKLAAGRILYDAIHWSDEHLIALGPDVAVLTGRMVTEVRVDGADKTLNNRVVTVWNHYAGTWRLVAFQSTPIAT